MIKLFTLLLLLPFLSFGQETKKITDKDTHEVYYVLKSNKSVRQGNYQKNNYTGRIVVNGYYKNGLKDSTWTEYYWNGITLKSQGSYSNDLRIGIWEFYDDKGVLIQKYDYTKKELVFFQPDENEDGKKYKVIEGSDTIETVLDRPPLYLGGFGAMMDVFGKSARYPGEAREKGVSGRVVVSFIIGNDGKPSNYHIVKSVGYGCDEEAIRVIMLLRDNWIAAVVNGKAVSVEYIMPFNFTLSNE